MIIPRQCTDDGRLITGTRVRELLRAHDEEAVLDYIPPTTLEAIRKLWATGWEVPEDR